VRRVYFTEGDLELLVILATQAATVLENARITRQRDLEAREKRPRSTPSPTRSCR